MKRAAIYSRFSTDLQSDRSIEDQVALCRQYAARSGLTIVATYEDRAASGASLHGRTGMLRLLADARAGGFDAVLAESLSRIGRDVEDRDAIRKRLTFYSVQLVTPSDGVVTPLVDRVRAIIDSQYLEDLKVSVRRGMAGVVRAGRHAGGRAYGYRPVPGKPGEMVIEPEEAAIVRRIVAEYLDGRTPREIARRLNTDGVPPPRGRWWTASTINGNHARGSGMLLNQLYAGRIAWNRVRMVKDPETGRRVSRVNPAAEHQTVEAEHLRIIDEDTWRQVQQVKADRGKAQPSQVRQPPRMLSGLLKCGCCGGGMASLGRDSTGKARVKCSAHRESGTCPSNRVYYLDTIERVAIAGLRKRLAEPKFLATYVQEYNAERRRLARTAIASRSKIEGRLAAADREVKRIVQAVAKGLIADEEVEAALPPLRAEIADLRTQLAAASEPPKVVELHPATIERYRQAVERLQAELSAGKGSVGEVATLRALVHRVVVHPTPGSFELEIVGRLAELTRSDAWPQMRVSGGSMVAEARYIRSPTTPDYGFFDFRQPA